MLEAIMSFLINNYDGTRTKIIQFINNDTSH